MKINGFQCDDCGNIYNYNVLDKGWMELEQRITKDEVEWLHFCSIGCLSAWALKQKSEDDNHRWRKA